MGGADLHLDGSIPAEAQKRNVWYADNLPLLVSPTRAARELSLSRRTIYDMIAAGELEAFRHGRRLMIRREELERFAAELEPVAGAGGGSA